jgi:branched-chain amino acid transport system substrate-binding protein
MEKIETAAKTAVRRRTILRAAIAGAGASALPLFNVARAGADTIKVGVINGITGVRSQFAEADDWTYGIIRDRYKNGIQIGGKTYQIEILPRDNQSSLNGTAPVANDLLLRQQVDMLLLPDSDGAIGAGELCDALGTPGISTMTPWQAMFFTRHGDPTKGFPATFHFFWGVDDLFKNYIGMWNSVSTNKQVGTLYFDNAVGKSFADPNRGLPSALGPAGLKTTDAGFFEPSTEDFSDQISRFQNAGVQIQSGFMFSPQWQLFWSQAAQAGYKPEICTVAGPFLFPSGIDVLGDRGDGMSTEILWTPSIPFSSSLTGQSAKALAAAYQTATGRQPTQPIGYVHALWEVGIAALQAAGDPHDKKAVCAAMKTLKMNTVVGPVDFGHGPVPGVSLTPLVGGQWRKTNGGAFKNDLKIVYNGTAPAIPVEAALEPLSKLS